jgi:hypothetical protein
MAGSFALMPFIQEVGIPQMIVTDNAPEEVHGEFGKIFRQFRIKQEQTVPYSPWSNLTECDDIGTVTRSTVPYSAQIDSGSERGTRWYMWYSSVIRRFPKHVHDIQVFISMQTVQNTMA